MIRFEERMFTLEDVFDFIKKHTPYEATGKVYEKGILKDATIEDFVGFNNIVLQCKDQYGSYSYDIFMITNFEFLMNNHKNLSLEWIDYLLKVHGEEYAVILKTELEGKKKRIFAKAQEKVKEFEEQEMSKANDLYFPYTFLEKKANEILGQSTTTEI